MGSSTGTGIDDSNLTAPRNLANGEEEFVGGSGGGGGSGMTEGKREGEGKGDSGEVVEADSTSTTLITNARLAYTERDRAQQTWSILCRDGRVIGVLPTVSDSNSNGQKVVDARGGLVLPSFCHAHIHLDKCFILDQCGELVTGDFSEAMNLTKSAKSRFATSDLAIADLYARGARLIRESVQCGVTCMRAFVEVDEEVGFACLDVGLRLKEEWRGVCDVQIAVFAQERLFPSDRTAPGRNLDLLREAAARPGVSVVGSAPYVEPSVDDAKRNIGFIFDIADTHKLAIDFHLDYNLDPNSEPLIYEVINQIKERPTPLPRITIGHATRLQLFSPTQWDALLSSIRSLPITFVSLPQSDMYMQGRAHLHSPLGAPRSTLRVPYLKEKYGVDIAMGVNNVDNAFTPQGSVDPLSLCTFGVAVFQSAREEDLRTLVRSITHTSKLAIGMSSKVDHAENPDSKSSNSNLAPGIGDRADFVILHGRHSVRSAVLNPPFERTTIKDGKVVAERKSVVWVADVPGVGC